MSTAPKLGHNAKRKKMMIYGGVAAAILLVLLLARRASAASSSSGSSGSSGTSAGTGTASTYDPYASTGSGAGGVDYSTQLASIDSNINSLAGAVASLQAGAQTPGPSTPGTSGSASDILSAITAGAQIFQAGAASVGAPNITVTAPRQPGPGNTKVKLPPPPKGGGHYVWHNGKPQLIHAVGKNKWAPGPPRKHPARKK